MEEMKPGRELDFEIAIKVMGWTRDNYGDWDYKGSQAWRRNDYGEHSFFHEEFNPGAHPFPPHYSTSIEAAWEVVELLRSKEIFLVLDNCEFEQAYEAEFTDFYETHRCSTRSDTAPHAICLAALKAVGVKSIMEFVREGMITDSKINPRK